MRLIITISLLLFSIGLLAQNHVIYNPYAGVNFDSARKSNLHMHTIESDGNQTVKERLLGNDGNTPGYLVPTRDEPYEILSIAEHDSYETAPSAEFSGPEPTWQWHEYSDLTGYSPSAVYGGNDSTSMYYSDMGGGVFAIEGNELTECQQENNYYTHVNSYFSNLGWTTCPGATTALGFDAYMYSIDTIGGLGVFNHPGRHAADASFYNGYFDDYYGVMVGIEIYNAGRYAPTQDPLALWDEINSLRDPDSLIWGFSNSDVHSSAGDDSTDMFKNYNIHFIETMTEATVRANFQAGAFTAHFAGTHTNEGGTNYYPTPRLENVDVTGTVITLTVTNYDSVVWYGTNSDTLVTDTAIDISNYLEYNFVRAEMYLDSLITHTQPFGINPAGDYYVKPSGGNDSWPGTSPDSAWATPQKAFETADAGDTVYFMDGRWTPTVYESGGDVYNMDATAGNGNSGESASNQIYYMAYPGETPVFDFSNATPPGTSNVGLYMDSIHFVTFKGIKWVGLDSTSSTGPDVHMINAAGCSNLTFEENIIDSCGGAGIRYFTGMSAAVNPHGYDTTTFKNNDFFRCVNNGGNHGDGIKYDQDTGAYVLFEGNQSLLCSDDGIDASGSGMRVIYNNRAVGMGHDTEGDGNGFKIGAIRDSVDNPPIIFIYNLGAFNRNPETDAGAGLTTPDYVINDTSYRRTNARIYNNTMIKNDIGFSEGNNANYQFRNARYRNNIAYASYYELDAIPQNVVITGFEYPESHNSWDYSEGGYSFVETDTVTVTAADFVSLDSATLVTQMQVVRVNGALPTITFGTLAVGSDLIDGGTENGWSEFADTPGLPAQTIYGSAPDVGAFENTAAAETQSMKTRSGAVAITRNGVLAIPLE